MKKNAFSIIVLFCVVFAVCTLIIHAQRLLDRTVAVVNGEAIMLSEFEQVSGPILDAKRQENPDITDEEITELKKLILDELVNNKLIVQAAKDKKIKVSRRQVDEQIEKIKASMPTPKAFTEELKKQGLTEKKLKERIEEQLMAEELTYTEVKQPIGAITPEEVSKVLGVLKKKLNGEEVKDLDDQDEQSIDQLVALVQNYINNLKAQELYRKWVKRLQLKAKITINDID